MKLRVKGQPGPPAVEDATRSAGDGPISSRRRKGKLTTAGRWVLGLFFTVFLAFGVGATYALALKPWINVVAARSWVPVNCRILTSEVRHHSGDSSTYSVEISYAYTFEAQTFTLEGRTFTGTRYDFTTGSSSGRKAKQAIVARYRPGSAAVCYVNPKNPSEAVINRSQIRDWGFGFIPLVFVLIGGGGICFAIFGQRKSKDSPANSRSALRARESRWSRGPAETEDFSAYPVDREGSMELVPSSTRVGKLVGIAFFAVFWNGIVSVFVVSVVRDIGRGGFIEWFFALFLLPFVAVGLFLIGLIVRFAMELSNPVPRLTVNRRAFLPGETLDLTWRFEGRAKRLKSVRFWLEGREEATYRRGTDTRTDKEIFATLEIASASGLASAEAGHATLRLPGRLMHSFKAANNRVVWELRVKGEIDWWPDLSEEFAVAIVAPKSSSHTEANPTVET
ncbi:hypothetical protein CMV30_08430 [Nibricoccus aquaticus]|uniref:DUF3592 domain-containing protein n=1 Tax=Nibricoccus aquaticus TaxID=2576891 RepID=A0A290QJB5_9BACT|nr:DUF3592 domain-containing protein [Nibricoccus aquaticus]ATC63972.1 hypothetical protein CMV30_08430 [Nibricoccus aquaticus]